MAINKSLSCVVVALMAVLLMGAQDGTKKKKPAVLALPKTMPVMPVIKVKPGQTIEWDACLPDRPMRPGSRDGSRVRAMLKVGQTETLEEQSQRTISIQSEQQEGNRVAVNDDLKMSWKATGFLIEALPCAVPGTTHDLVVQFSAFGTGTHYETSIRVVILPKE